MSELDILHVDLDAFYASVEQLLQPELRGRPVVVGGTQRRGVVCAASYEARRFGVRSAMPTVQAYRLCPDAVFLPPRFGEYEDFSRRVMRILRDVTPLVEPISLDEAFLDVRGARRRLGDAPTVAALVRTRVRDETGLTASVGVASTKFLSKIASDLSKPDGLLVVEPGHEVAFLAPLPVSRLWGVGPATQAKLERIGVRTIGQLARLSEATVVAALGRSHGAHLHALANNVDPRAVVPDREAKSIGAEETYPYDLVERAEIDRETVRLADRVASRLRRAGLSARTVTVKVRAPDFSTITRARTLPRPTQRLAEVVEAARDLLDQLDLRPGVRLLGLSCSHLGPPEAVPLTLDLALGDRDDPARRDRDDAIERAVDEVRARYGDRAVQPATLLPRTTTGSSPQ